jgi:hypothetical protein
MVRPFFLTYDQKAIVDNPSGRLYVASYMIIRTAVGILGLLLPVILFVAEYFYIRGPVSLRGSLSAYYFSTARDFFVGILWVIGILLITYMAAQWKQFDFIFSSIAGILLIGVVTFPTTRPDLPAGSAPCGTAPEPVGCSATQQWLGESNCAHLHYVCAVSALLVLAVIAYIFGRREVHGGNAAWLSWFHFGCAGVIVLGLLIGGIGAVHSFQIWLLKPSYIAEVMAILGFAAGWLVKGWALWGVIGAPPVAFTTPPQGPTGNNDPV